MTGCRDSVYTGKSVCSDCNGQWKFHRETKKWVPMAKEIKNQTLITVVWVFMLLLVLIFMNSCSCPQWRGEGCSYESTLIGEFGKWLNQIL